MSARVQAFFDPATYTVSYLVSDPASRDAAIVDPVLDFDPKSGRTATHSADAILAAAAAGGLRIRWILETHAHADHLSAAQHLKARSGAPVVIGAAITQVQIMFKGVFNDPDMPADGRQFDRLVNDGDKLPLGTLEFEVLHTPGHTPACVTYRIGNAAFIGDTLFMPDYGTARADFPGGDARTLYRSIRRILALPPETRLFMCHDYKAPGRDRVAWETTVAEERARNVHIHDGVGEDEFVRLRQARDKTLEMPTLILPSIQVNMRAGNWPPPEANGTVYLKLPVNAL
ncbi:MAG: MBL fold metallo-hydrolase [Alphaproteobacteria bacterium]|nr:MBL fold metallo-hydrolase [Alphaproteobacteria bacterium]